MELNFAGTYSFYLIAELIEHFWIVTLLLILLVWLGMWLRQKPEVLQFIDRSKLKIPLIGSLIGKSLVARFCRTLGTLLESGVALVDALDILGSSTGNLHLNKKISTATTQVSQGKSLYKQLKRQSSFPN